MDTLARFYGKDTVTYVRCENEKDEHYEELEAMEEEIREFAKANDGPYCLILLSMAGKVEWEGGYLPATYADFLIMSGIILAPFYDPLKGEIAEAALWRISPGREIIGINRLPLIKQHDPLHCVTMRHPGDFIE